MAEDELRRLLRGLQITSRLGFQGQCNVFASLRLGMHQVRHALQQMRNDGVHRLACIGRMAKAHRHGGDAAVHPFRQQSSQDVDASQGVAHTLCMGPIRRIHILLDWYAMESTVGKCVQREHIGLE